MSARGDNFDTQPDNFVAFLVGGEVVALTEVSSRDAIITRIAQGHFQLQIGTGLAFGDYEMSGFVVDAGATGLTWNPSLPNAPANNLIDIFVRDPATGALTDPSAGQFSVRRVAHAG